MMEGRSLLTIIGLCFIATVWTVEGCEDKFPFCPDISTMCHHSDIKMLCPLTCNSCAPVPVYTAQPPVTGGECGKPDIRGVRVIGGKKAVRGSWPWQILLMLGGRAMCGGTLIAPQWVVTAAHCVYGREQSGGFSIRVGEQDRNLPEGSEATYRVSRVYRHREYDASRLNNDIALLKLNHPVAMNRYVKPICLPSRDVPVGTKCYITGWGKITSNGRMTSQLQQAVLPVVSNQACFEKNRRRIPIPITDAMICGGDGGVTSRSGCHGDSGGPFVCQVEGVWELHGAVSHGSPVCSSSETYTVFARITHFTSWIRQTMKE